MKQPSIAVKCQECGKAFKTRSFEPQCPKCGGGDIDINYDYKPRKKA